MANLPAYILNIGEEKDFALEKDNLYHPQVPHMLQHFYIEIFPKSLNSIQTKNNMRAQDSGNVKRILKLLN